MAVKSEAVAAMAKAYVTYSASSVLAGYENGGKSWIDQFNSALAENVELQEKTLASGSATTTNH